VHADFPTLRLKRASLREDVGLTVLKMAADLRAGRPRSKRATRKQTYCHARECRSILLPNARAVALPESKKSPLNGGFYRSG